MCIRDRTHGHADAIGALPYLLAEAKVPVFGTELTIELAKLFEMCIRDRFKKGQEGVHNYTVEEVKGSDATVTYDTMKANVTVTVKHDGTAKVLIATVGDIADKEFNNRVTPPEEPKFQPEKYVLNTAKFSITDNKLLDDDAELTDKYGETNTDPYVDKADNNEAENINTKSVKRGEKIYYQVWLDTTKFDAANKDNVQTVGITDDYDETKVDVDGSAIKAYDSVTGADVYKRQLHYLLYLDEVKVIPNPT